MGEFIVMKKLHRVAELVPYMPDLVQRIRLIIVISLQGRIASRIGSSIVRFSSTHQEIKHAKTQHFEGDAHVSTVVEPVQHLDAQTEKIKSHSEQVSLNLTGKQKLA